MDKDRRMKLNTPFLEIKVNVLVTTTTRPISQGGNFVGQLKPLKCKDI